MLHLLKVIPVTLSHKPMSSKKPIPNFVILNKKKLSNGPISYMTHPQIFCFYDWLAPGLIRERYQ